MKSIQILACAALLGLSAPAILSSPASACSGCATHAKKAKPTVAPKVTRYECPKCHMTFSAADAKKNKFKCTMDGATLKPIAAPVITKYECPKCHMTFSTADAKKNKFKCTMDGATLKPVKPKKP